MSAQNSLKRLSLSLCFPRNSVPFPAGWTQHCTLTLPQLSENTRTGLGSSAFLHPWLCQALNFAPQRVLWHSDLSKPSVHTLRNPRWEKWAQICPLLKECVPRREWLTSTTAQPSACEGPPAEIWEFTGFRSLWGERSAWGLKHISAAKWNTNSPDNQSSLDVNHWKGRRDARKYNHYSEAIPDWRKANSSV